MPEWQPETIKEYRKFLEDNNAIHDQIERSLKDLADSLNRAWTGNGCLSCPLGELTALAAATLKFYQESKRK